MRSLEWQSLVLLDLCDCDDIEGHGLELGSIYSLRVLIIPQCENLTRIVCQ